MLMWLIHNILKVSGVGEGRGVGGEEGEGVEGGEGNLRVPRVFNTCTHTLPSILA